ncbi:unnamed protein product, partial [Ixodes pacificus]
GTKCISKDAHLSVLSRVHHRTDKIQHFLQLKRLPVGHELTPDHSYNTEIRFKLIETCNYDSTLLRLESTVFIVQWPDYSPVVTYSSLIWCNYKAQASSFKILSFTVLTATEKKILSNTLQDSAVVMFLSTRM